jgi:hypothetical protein
MYLDESVSGELYHINVFVLKENPYPFLKKDTEPLFNISTKKFFPRIF